MSGSIKADLSLEIDPAGLQASLALALNASAQEWTRALIVDYLRGKGIASGIDGRAVEDALEWLAKRTEGTRSVVVARGTPPVPGVAAEIRWADREIPPELLEAAERLFAAAPRVFSRRIEKERVEETVRKPAPLPFLPEREERSVTWKKKVVTEQVDVDPTVLARGFVRAGETLATVARARPGRAGRDVFGKPVPAEKPEPREIYLGGPLQNRGEAVLAEAAGFFRGGKGWIELLPFTPSASRVYGGTDGTTCLLDYTPGSDGSPPPDPGCVLAQAVELGFPRDTLLPDGEIGRLLGEARRTGAPLQAVPLSLSRDAEIRTEIAQDRMAAWLSLLKGRGAGTPLTLEAIAAAIRRLRLRRMDAEQVRRAVLAFYRGPESALEKYLLAEGQKPTAGEDGSVRWQVKFLDPREAEIIREQSRARPQGLEKVPALDRLPLEAVQDMALVGKRAVVAKITPPAVGKPGMDVFGAALSGVRGREPKLELLGNLSRLGDEVVTRVEGLLERAQLDGVTVLRVRAHRDAEARVRLAEDRMTAWVSLFPPEGTGRPIEAEDVLSRLESQEITQGLDREALSAAILEARGGKAVCDVPVARGTPPTDSPDRSLVFKVQRASGSAVTISSTGQADFKRQDRITLVQADALIAEVPPAVQACDGVDVTGRRLPARQGKVTLPEAGRNVRLSEDADGAVRYYARVSGEVLFNGRTLQVAEVHTIEGDVGSVTGNVRFAGNVRVGGSVQSGYAVVSEGSITVGGTVEAALLSAAGEIVVSGGVKGGGRAVLRARTGIRCQFAEEATLLCIQDVRLERGSLRCRIKCNGSLSLTSERGHIIGGSVRARTGVSVMNLGSERGAATVVSFGQDYLVLDRIEAEERELRRLRERVAALDSEIRRLDRELISDKAQMDRAWRQKAQCLKLIESKQQRIFALRERFEAHHLATVTVRGTAFPGVVLESHGRVREIRAPLKGVVFHFNTEKGCIEHSPLAPRRGGREPSGKEKKST